MARRKSGKFFSILMLAVFSLAVYGGWVLWNKKDVKRTVSKVERSVKAAERAW